MNIEIEIFDPNYWMFHAGIALERYEEHDNTYQWIRRKFVIGLLIFSININWKVGITKLGA